jgi:hypothetical protein
VSELSIFESTALPAHLADSSLFGAAKDLVSATGFPVISIKGKTWSFGHGGEKQIIREPGSKRAAAAIQVVIVDYSPNLTKVYYEQKFDGNSSEGAKPTCYSNNGETPATDAQEPQSTRCATCAHNQWGSRISDAGTKGKSCQDNRRLAVAMPDNIGDPMLLRIPPTSLKNLAAYQELLARKGFGMRAMITELSFAAESASPLIEFEPVGFITEAQMAEVASAVEMDVTKQIIGAMDVPREVPFEQAAPKVEAAPAPKAEAPKKAAPKKAAPKEEPKVEEVDDGLAAELDDVFADLDGFDD